MHTFRRLGLFLFLISNSIAFAECDTRGDIAQALGCLDGVTFREVTAMEDPQIPAGYRRFELQMEQPVDHFDPGRGTFRQRLALLHRGSGEPMILQTSGYAIFGVALSQLAKAFDANQIQVEHRYFDQSTPAVLDWSRLTILQSAMDFHRVTGKLKKIYGGRWVNTGASKGGMTSTYHRRYFPGDLDGTVADVAPLSFSREDSRYVSFVQGVGGERYRECRDRLVALQFALLRRRAEVMPAFPGSYVHLGGREVAYEHAVIELPFAFWQYKSPEDPKVGCAHIPAPDAETAKLVEYLKVVNDVTIFGDGELFRFLPYFLQAGTQLGGPAAVLSHLAGYRKHPYTLGQYMPPRTAHFGYSNRTMRDIEAWARNWAERILFVYGELDPWSAAAYPRRGAGADYHWFLVPGGNHASKIFGLPPAEKAAALAIVARWLGKDPVQTEIRGESLDDLELRARRSAGLP